MNSLMRMVLSLSASGSVLFLAVLVITKLGRNRLNTAWKYYVWLLVALRLLLPITTDISLVGTFFAEPSNVTMYRTLPAPPVQDGVDAVLPDSGDAAAKQTPKESALPFQEGLADIANRLWMLWAFPALLLAVYKAFEFHRFVSCMCAAHAAVADPDALSRFGNACDELGIHRRIDFYENPQAASPLVIGFLKPRIILPSLKISESEFRYVMMHELTHLRRGDQIYKWLMQLILCIHWFNPLIYWMVRKVNAACELACDEAVIRRLDERSRYEYGTTLINSLCYQNKRKQVVMGSALHENAMAVKKRLEAIMIYKKKSKVGIMITSLLSAFLIAGGVLLGALVPESAMAANSETLAESGLRMIQNEELMTLEGKDIFSYSSAELYMLWQSGIWDIPEGESIEYLDDVGNAAENSQAGVQFPISAGLCIIACPDETDTFQSIDQLPGIPLEKTSYRVQAVDIRDTGISGPFGIEVGMTTDTLLSLLTDVVKLELDADSDGFDALYIARYQEQDGTTYTIEAYSLLDMISYCIITRE